VARLIKLLSVFHQLSKLEVKAQEVGTMVVEKSPLMSRPEGRKGASTVYGVMDKFAVVITRCPLT